MATNKNKHLTQDDRNVIAIGIVNGSSKKAIADNLGKDKSTIGKEIRAHRYLSHKSTLSLECENYAHCKFKRKNCTVNCPDYSKFRCKRRDRTPGACNGCEKLKSCRFDKYLYKPTIAYEEYRSELVESRTGINLTSSEAVELGNTIKPLLLKGHSPYQIIAAHPELGISEKTLYNYIEQGVFECVGIANIDLRIKVKRKMTAKKKTIYKKRQDRKFLLDGFTQITNPMLSLRKSHTFYKWIQSIMTFPMDRLSRLSNSSNMGSCLLYITTRRLLQIWLTD